MLAIGCCTWAWQMGATVHFSAQASHRGGFSSCGAQALGHVGSVVVAHGLSCPEAVCEIFPNLGSNPCPLHRQADSSPRGHQGSPHLLLNFVANAYHFQMCILTASLLVCPTPSLAVHPTGWAPLLLPHCCTPAPRKAPGVRWESRKWVLSKSAGQSRISSPPGPALGTPGPQDMRLTAPGEASVFLVLS